MAERVHVLAGLSGASEARRLGVMRSHAGLLSQAIALLQDAGTDPERWALCRLALQVWVMTTPTLGAPLTGSWTLALPGWLSSGVRHRL